VAALGATPSGWVVVLNGDEPAAATTARLERGGGFAAEHRYEEALRGFSARLTEGQVAQLRRDPAVAFLQPDTELQGHGTATIAPGEAVQPGVRRIGAASSLLIQDAASTPVAVLDTGVDLANADLNAVSGTNCITPGASAQDDNGHGTHVAGIVAARNQGATVPGVAPGTRVVAVKVLNARNTGTLSQFLCGINWLAQHGPSLGIRVANMSVGGSGTDDGACGKLNSDAMHQAVCGAAAAGITLVVSAGNSGVDLAKTVPASYPEVLTVTAMSDTDGLPGAKGVVPKCTKGQADDRYASFSNYAVSAEDSSHTVAAPGTCIVSDLLGGGTATYNGTSQAAPHAAGVVAQCIGSAGMPGPCGALVPADVIARVRADAGAAASTNGFTGDPLRPVTGRAYGALVTAAGL
jgi:subtilisin family serine protease